MPIIPPQELAARRQQWAAAREPWRQAEQQRQAALVAAVEAMGGRVNGNKFFDADGDALDEWDLADMLNDPAFYPAELTTD